MSKNLIFILVLAFCVGTANAEPIVGGRIAFPAVQSVDMENKEMGVCVYIDTNDRNRVRCKFMPKNVFFTGSEECHVDYENLRLLCGEEILKGSF